MGSRRIYPEQTQTLYLWTLNLDGTISKNEINKYKITPCKVGCRRYSYRIEGKSDYRSVTDEQLDRFLNGRVCSFDPDVNKAKKIIEETLEARVRKFKDDYDNARLMLNALRGTSI